MRTYLITSTLVVAAVAALGGCSREVSYRTDVAPVLAANCNECHSQGKPGFVATGFDTTTYQGLLNGGKFGPLIKPGDAFTSAFNMVVEGRVHSSIQMPKDRARLADRDIETLKTWVTQGAKLN
jgi:hypothetical protein